MQVDKMLKRWKAILSQLSAQREKFNRERFANNIHYISQWIDEVTDGIGEDVNASDGSDVNKALNLLQTFEEQLKEKTAQMEKLTSSRYCASSSEAVERLSKRFQRLNSALRKRRRELQDKWARLESVTSREEIQLTKILPKILESFPPISEAKISRYRPNVILK